MSRRDDRRQRREMSRLARGLAREILDEEPDIGGTELETRVAQRLESDFDIEVKAGSVWLPIILEVVTLLLKWWNRNKEGD
jgi:hypothetical protein